LIDKIQKRGKKRVNKLNIFIVLIYTKNTFSYIFISKQQVYDT
jgi:hypothetical protein